MRGGYAAVMISTQAAPAVPQRSGDELREEFRSAQRQRLLRRGVAPWRDNDSPEDGVQGGAATAKDEHHSNSQPTCEAETPVR